MPRSIAARLLVCLTLVTGGLVAAPGMAAAAALSVPAQFTDTLVGTASGPTGIAFMPDGRMLVTTQGGRLRIGTGDALLPTPALDLSSRICTNSERGLLGVAADSDPSSKAIYLYYTARGTDVACPTNDGATKNPDGAPVNRVSKFIVGDDNVVNPASEVILLDGIFSPAGNHNAGDLAVGKDGYLYVSVGDGGCDYNGDSGCGGANNASRDRNVLNGKIIRITRDGGVPTDNPFTGTGTASCRYGLALAGQTCREAFVTGLRNPFRFAFDPNAAGTSFRINDVGQNVWEEIDQGVKGADYGWNDREGHCQNTGSATNCGAAKPSQYTDPIYDYTHAAGGCGSGTTNGGSITGGAFVPNTAGWPAPWAGSYLFGDYVCGKIFSLPSSGPRVDFATGPGNSGGPVHLEFGTFSGGQALFYTSYTGSGEIRRIAYTGSQNRPPTAVLGANPTSGNAPLTVAFDATGSTDPDGNPLTYSWDFGDGTAKSTTAKPSHTYAAGSYTASLTVTDPAGVSATATKSISSGNTAPTATITAPGAADKFTVGTVYTLRGTGTDAQDGTLADGKLSWTILKHHDQHTHPFLGPVTGNNITFTAPEPEDLAAAANSYLEIQLTVTDSAGLTTTVTRTFNPATVPLTLATSPAGRTVTVNGTAVTGPVTSWAGWRVTVAAATQTDASGRTYAFDGWSDGGAASHIYVTPASAATLTATFSLRGLQGAYFDELNFAGPRVDRLDSTIGFNWARNAPVAGIGADTFSVRWTGQVSPRYSQTYTFSTTSDDGIRVWVNGVRLINQWTNHSATVHTGTIALTANVKYAIVVEYYDNTHSAVAQLRWASPSQASEIIPVERLFPS